MMAPLPHRYSVTARGREAGDVELKSDRLSTMRSASPAEFGGPGDRWSPETYLVGAVADCFILTFRAIAAASKLSWESLRCDVTGTLDRIDRETRFTQFDLSARLIVAPGVDVERATQALEKAERTCLISRSLKATVTLDADVVVLEDAPIAVPPPP